MGKYIVKEFDANSGIFKSKQEKLYQEIADYANKKGLRIVSVSDMDEKGKSAVIFEEVK
ncbi:hypothetical protein ACF3NG_02110 [Aerococcaceae bacterium WGS1372]